MALKQLMAEIFTIYSRFPVDVTSSVSVTRSFTEPVVVGIHSFMGMSMMEILRSPVLSYK